MLLAFERMKQVPRRTAPIDLVSMVKTAGADTPDKVVDHLIRRFLSVTLTEKDRALLVDFLKGKLGTITTNENLESSLRELLYLVLSTPEYQLG